MGRILVVCRIVEGRQRAERCRVLGNNAFGQQQWAEAYRCYEEGIYAERSNVKLHANAAMAAVKMGCYVQAIEHCDKVLRIQEFLLEQPDDPIVVKTLQRRAKARSALGHYREALAVMSFPDHMIELHDASTHLLCLKC
jgi:tetratricopeptide (TPR) repeat protein